MLPVGNVTVYVLDPHGGRVPIGVVGEICVGGVGVGRGYRNDPDRTAASFIDDPHSPTPGRLMYRTGDLGRFLANGSLEYLGRTDHQVKIRGQRVELGEIESILSEQPGVREVVVTAVGADTVSRQLVAYLVVRRSTPLRSRAGCRSGCPRTCCPRNGLCCQPCRWAPAARWIGRGCQRRSGSCQPRGTIRWRLRLMLEIPLLWC